MYEIIEKHYLKNRFKYVKTMGWRTGTHEAGEDIVQIAYERAIRYYSSYNPLLSFDRWFSRILNNCLREFKNIQKGFSGHEEFDEEFIEGTACGQYNLAMVEEILLSAGDKKEILREVIHLHYVQDFTIREICHITDQAYGTVHQMIRRFNIEVKERYDSN
jgi:DNA-directed RNA polymerase specialized sigma24 family protein